MRDTKGKVEQADGSSGRHHTFLKKYKRRKERHKAKRNPECIASYKRFSGYES